MLPQTQEKKWDRPSNYPSLVLGQLISQDHGKGKWVECQCTPCRGSRTESLGETKLVGPRQMEYLTGKYYINRELQLSSEGCLWIFSKVVSTNTY